MMRKQLFAVIGLPLVGAVIAVGLHLRTASTPPPPATKPVVPTHGYGFATPLADLSDAELGKDLADMQSMGVTWVRYDVNWSNIQQDGPSSYDWSDTDRIAKAVQAHHMHSLMILDFTPPWARTSGCHLQSCNPANSADYGKFAAIAAQRYQPYGVNAWEIWNEPNMDFFFHPANVPAYVKLLQAADTQIKQVEPNATVVVAGPAPASTNGRNYAPVDFVKAVYAAGAHGYFDAMAAHPYSYPAFPNNQDGADTNWGVIKAIHNVMASNGDGTKQVWITEYGDPTGGPTPSDHNTEAEQAAMLRTAVTSFHAYPWAGPFFYFNYQDKSTSTYTNENFFGLRRPDGSAKPAYDAYRELIAAHR